jgi:drug/metabolite transporter (DMT)-like permease
MKAILINLSAWMIVPIMDALAKYLSWSLPVLQITWGRYFFTVVFTLSFILIFFRKSLVWSKNPNLQIFRGLILLSANILFFYSISVISLAKALTLAFIHPLIVTALSPLFLKEKVGIKRWFAVLIGFIGALIVIRPGFLELNLPSLAAFGTGVCYGFYLIITRKLSNTDNPLLTLLFTGIVGAIIMTSLMPMVWVPPTLNQWYMLASIGLVASVAHGFIIISFSMAEASKLAPLSYSEIITNIIIGYYVFSDMPDKLTFVGLFIIMLSGVYVWRRQIQNKNYI